MPKQRDACCMGATKEYRRNSPHYVYFVRCPESGTVRYIGISTNIEERSHDGEVALWRDEFRKRGLEPIKHVVAGPLTFKQALLVESRLLLLHGVMYPDRLFNTSVPKLRVKSSKWTIILTNLGSWRFSRRRRVIEEAVRGDDAPRRQLGIIGLFGRT